MVQKAEVIDQILRAANGEGRHEYVATITVGLLKDLGQFFDGCLMIAVVAFIFMPLTFVTGLLGMNVTGIPFAQERWAFWGVVGFCTILGLVVLAWFGMRHWLRR